MTIKEKRIALSNYCVDCETCNQCALLRWTPANDVCCDFTDNGWPDRMIDAAYDYALGTRTPSAVEHPKHYNREGAMECIDEMLMLFGKDAVMGFCLCNAWKYRYRAADKNGEEDLKKSDWYLTKYRELKDGAE